jgi:hypothetical protein
METDFPRRRRSWVTSCGPPCAAASAATGRSGGRRSVGNGEFRYDPLSYALNFDDQGPEHDEYETSIEDFGDADGDGGLLVYRGFSSLPPPRWTTRAREAAVVAGA